jgi:drug/metabolite transporter (DMT)-like permease
MTDKSSGVQMKIVSSRQKSSTILGILAIIFWSTTISLSRSLTENLGVLAAASYIYLLGSVIGVGYIAIIPNGFKKIFQLPIKYLLGCGSLFVAYAVFLYLAVGTASNRQQAIEVGIINYLWPSFTLIFSVPILNKKARISLIPGIVLALAGVFLALTQTGKVSLEIFIENIQNSFLPYLFALFAAVCWALYSNFSRLWAGDIEGSAVPVFFLSAGVVLTAIKILFPIDVTVPHWTTRTIFELICIVIFPSFLAYLFWDTAVRKGRIILVVSLSYFIPLFATLIGCLYLKVNLSASLLIACALIIAGAIICKFSVVDV